MLPGNRTQPFVRLTGGCRHQSGGEHKGSGGRDRTFARLIQSQSGSPERARMTDPADGFEPSSTASKTVSPPRRAGSVECGARIELASRSAVDRSRTCTKPVKSRLLTTERRRQSARRGDRTHLQQIKNLLPHQSAWRAWSSHESARARSSHDDYSLFKVSIARRQQRSGSRENRARRAPKSARFTAGPVSIAG